MRRTILPVSIIIFALSSLSMSQTIPPAERAISPDHIKLNDDRGIFQIDPFYEYADAVAGQSFTLKITISTTVAPEMNIKVDKCVPDSSSALLKIESNGSVPEDKAGLLVTTYSYNVTIDPKAEARNHRIRLELQYPDKEVVTRHFNLKVGVRSKGKLTVVQDEEFDEPTFYTGQRARYLTTLRNDFPDYTINIKKISVESIPGDLIEFTDNALVKFPITLKPSEQTNVQLDFNVKSMDFTRLISGFGDSPKLKLTVTYDDGNKREVSDFTHKLNVKVRPRDSVLLMAMLAGVVLGGLIRFYLEFLARHKKINRRELLKFVLYTVIFGTVVAAFAFLGKVQVIAFKTYGSYDNPLVIFIIGLAAAVGGLQLFASWYKTLRPATGENSAAGEERPRSRSRRRRRRETNQDE